MLEKKYTQTEFIKKLRRFADALETGRKFSIQIVPTLSRILDSAKQNRDG